MEIIKTKTNFDFLGWRWPFIILSLSLIAMTAYQWVSTGDKKFGVDFRGGTEIIVRFKQSVDPGAIRKSFEDAGFSDVIVQSFEDNKQDFSLRLSQDQSSEEARLKVKQTLDGIGGGSSEILKEDFVGPVIGEQIRRDAYIAIILSLAAILIYVGARFEWQYGVGGIAALFHDVLVATGFVLLTERQLNAGILAALLTIVGYSINDTIVIYDRIRENIEKRRKAVKGKPPAFTKEALRDVMNLSLNETLSRTILTSFTAFLVVMSLWLFGGGAVSDISFTLMVGIVVGCYSTIFIACPIVLACHRERDL